MHSTSCLQLFEGDLAPGRGIIVIIVVVVVVVVVVLIARRYPISEHWLRYEAGAIASPILGLVHSGECRHQPITAAVWQAC